MMLRQLPILPTIIVLAAAATMVALGVWQIGRADEKAALISKYSNSSAIVEEVKFPLIGDGADVWFRRSSFACLEAGAIEPVAGTGANGAKGWAMRTTCKANADTAIIVDLGFARDLETPKWNGGEVAGVIAPGPRLVADPALAGLQPLAQPNPNDLPNNHIAYAGQWFFFAITALVIYVLALRSRQARRSKP